MGERSALFASLENIRRVDVVLSAWTVSLGDSIQLQTAPCARNVQLVDFKMSLASKTASTVSLGKRTTKKESRNVLRVLLVKSQSELQTRTAQSAELGYFRIKKAKVCAKIACLERSMLLKDEIAVNLVLPARLQILVAYLFVSNVWKESTRRRKTRQIAMNARRALHTISGKEPLALYALRVPTPLAWAMSPALTVKLGGLRLEVDFRLARSAP